MKLIFATQNQHKRNEVQEALGNTIEVISLHDLNFHEELPETHETLEENALEKALFIQDKFRVDCFSEDTGLEIDALHGEPGVYSARYAGAGKNAADNIALVLEKMKDATNRSARFRTVICLIAGEQKYFFEGIVNGKIVVDQKGNSGFGYDPIFVPEGFDKTFAEMTQEEKNSVSHRGKAVEKMKKFLLQEDEHGQE